MLRIFIRYPEVLNRPDIPGIMRSAPAFPAESDPKRTEQEKQKWETEK